MKFLKKNILSLLIISAVFVPKAFSQYELMPEGIGVYGMAYRGYSEQTQKYNNSGNLESLAAPFNKTLSGKNLLDGAMGDDLKQLAEELKKFDGESTRKDSLLNTINLGSLHGDVKGKINAKYLGLGYGLTKNISIFTGIPWVSASVDARLYFDGENNSQLIKQRLGNLAFKVLTDGLDKASHLSANMVNDSLKEMGYQSINHWENTGLGDILIGSVIGRETPFHKYFKSLQSITTTLSIPTGYVDSPDILTDISIGNGYYLLTNRFSQRVIYKEKYWLGLEGTFGLSFNTKLSKRVPVKSETLVDQSRKITCNYIPGNDIDFGLSGGRVFSFLKLASKIGYKSHFKDKYTGSLKGNYDKLSENSDMSQLYTEPSILIDTTQLYKNKKFPIPFFLQLSGHFPLSAKNSIDEKYFELSIRSFFATSHSSTSSKHIKKKRHRHKIHNKHTFWR